VLLAFFHPLEGALHEINVVFDILSFTKLVWLGFTIMENCG